MLKTATPACSAAQSHNGGGNAWVRAWWREMHRNARDCAHICVNPHDLHPDYLAEVLTIEGDHVPRTSIHLMFQWNLKPSNRHHYWRNEGRRRRWDCDRHWHHSLMASWRCIPNRPLRPWSRRKRWMGRWPSGALWLEMHLLSSLLTKRG